MSKPKRIAQVIGNLETGGAQVLLIEMMKRLDRSRFDPVLVHFREPNHFEEETRSGGWNVHRLRVSRSCRPAQIMALARLFREQDISLVHTHSDFANFAGRAAAIHAGVPHLLVHYQNTYEHRMDRHFRNLEAHLAPHTDGFVACSMGVKDFLAENLDLAGRPVRLLRNAVDTAPYCEARQHREEHRRRLGIPPDVFHIVHTARLEPHKQPEMLLRALSLSTRRPDRALGDWRLTFVGSGSQHAELERELARMDEEAERIGGQVIAPRVHFAGWTRDMAGWLAAADVFFLVSRNEGLPLSLVEAMAAGTPTVSPDIIGPREVVESDSQGLLVDSSRPDAVLDALHRMRTDTEYYETVVRNGIERAREFTVETFMERCHALYEEVLAGELGPVPRPNGFLRRAVFLMKLRRLAKASRDARREAVTA